MVTFFSLKDAQMVTPHTRHVATPNATIKYISLTSLSLHRTAQDGSLPEPINGIQSAYLWCALKAPTAKETAA